MAEIRDGILCIAEKHSEREDIVFRETSVYFTQTNAGSYRATLEGMLPMDKFMQEVELYLGKNFDLSETEMEECLQRMYRAIFGLHVLEPLIRDRDVSDIRVNDWNNVRVSRSGKRMGTDVTFFGKTDLELFVMRLAYRNKIDLGRQPNASSLFVDRKSAENAILRIDVQMPCLTSEEKVYAHIRKIPKQKLGMEYLISADMLERGRSDELVIDLIRKGRSVLVSGKNGSGKTHLLNAMLDQIPLARSGLIVQESDELYSAHPDLRFLHIYEPPAFAKDERSFDLLDLTKMGNVSSNDVFVVGEIKGAEALYAITQSASTGCQFLATIHANDSRASVTQLAAYAKYASDYPLENLYEMIAGTHLVCIYIRDFKVTEITEITGWNEKERRLQFKALYERR